MIVPVEGSALRLGDKGRVRIHVPGLPPSYLDLADFDRAGDHPVWLDEEQKTLIPVDRVDRRVGVWYLSQSEKAILIMIRGRRFVCLRSVFDSMVRGRNGSFILSEILPDGVHV